jgi:hypothetical protein
MSRWKALPEGLGPEAVQLVVQLRRLKDRGGLSLAGLEVKTGYSSSSWDRYLNGRTLPPEAAVAALAEAVGAEPARFLVLRDAAVCDVASETAPADSGSGSGSEGGGPEGGGPEAAGGRLPRRWALTGAVGLGAAGLLAAVVVPLTANSGHGPAAAASGQGSAGTRAVSAARQKYGCHYAERGGLWYAGESITRVATTQLGFVGRNVAEVQCLLTRMGISPGGVDGIFGPLTERAVRRAQLRAGVGVDGIVGPETWQVLRAGRRAPSPSPSAPSGSPSAPVLP